MSNEFKKIKEPNAVLYLSIGLSVGIVLCMMLTLLTNFLIENVFIEAIDLITFLIIIKLILPSMGSIIAYIVYRRNGFPQPTTDVATYICVYAIFKR